MAINTSGMVSVLRARIAAAPTVATIDGNDYTGIRTALSTDRGNLPGGYGDSYRFSVLFVREDFATLPTARRTTAQIGDTTYRILGHREDAIAVGLRLDFGEEVPRSTMAR